MTLKEEILRSGLNFPGNKYWESYAGKALIKNLPKDLDILQEDFVEVYTALFGEDTKELFEEVYENREFITEDSAQRIIDALNKPGSTWGIINRMKNSTLEADIMTAPKTLSANLERVGSGVGGFLSRIGALLASGFTWAKNLLTQGISWITSNPIARVAAPLIALAGSALVAIKIINKIRSKKKMKPLTDKEQEAIKSIAEKDREKIEQYKKAMKK